MIIDSKDNLFLELSNHFVGEEAKLFSYSPGFQEVCISIKKYGRYFLFKFSEVRYVKTPQTWIFSGFDIDVDINSLFKYSISDKNTFKVNCKKHMVIEIINGKEVTDF